MREPSTAEVLPVPVIVNGRTYFWTAQAGLDSAVVGEVDAWIRRRAGFFAVAARMRGLDIEDLLQEGRAGALRAAQTFDPSAGSTYLHYADAWIRQSMIAALNRSHDVYMPARHRQQALKDGTLPGMVSLDVVDHGSTLLDLQICEQPTPLETAQQTEVRKRLAASLDQLPRLQRLILTYRYGLDGRPEESLEAIAQLLGCGRERVRRYQIQAIARLRTLLRETPMETLKAPPRHMPTAHGRQITVQDVIRDQKRQERSASEAEKARRKSAKDATKGVPLFEEE